MCAMYAMGNALIPVVTVIGLMPGRLLGGAVAKWLHSLYKFRELLGGRRPLRSSGSVPAWRTQLRENDRRGG